MSVRAHVMEVELSDGEVIHAEVVSAGGGDVSALDRLPLGEAGDLVRRIGNWAAETVRSGLPERPDEFEITFGMKLGAKTGRLIGILAEASGEASFTVRMKWNGERPPGDRAGMQDTADPR